MIVDHRTYTLIPGKLPAFLKLYSEKAYAVQSKHLGMPVGWYVSMDIGELNQVVHMWQYEDLQDRADRRAKLASEPVWQEYLAEGLPMMQSMQNKILMPAPFWKP